VLGVRWSDADIGVPPRPREVEAIVDPKVPIADLERRRGRPIDEFLEALAESISLDLLRGVPSFADMWQPTAAALVDLGYRRR
jgi:hypothetical protein